MGDRQMAGGRAELAKTTKRMMLRIRKVAAWYGPKAIKELARIMTNSESDAVRVSAAIALLDRAYGKPGQQVAVTGADGGPIEVNTVSIEEAARRMAYLISEADKAAIPGICEEVNTEVNESPKVPNLQREPLQPRESPVAEGKD
jgi:hypothetical protein